MASRILRNLLWAFFFLGATARAGTIYVSTKDYPWQWGSPPTQYQDFKNGGFRVRAWLEGLTAPKLVEAPRALKKEVNRYFEIDRPATIRFAVLGPPRSTNGHDPYFFAWVEWVESANYGAEGSERHNDRKAGLARIAIEGQGERKVDIRDWHWEKDLKDKELDQVVPWDAAVLARKMLDLHAFRPRQDAESADDDGAEY